MLPPLSSFLGDPSNFKASFSAEGQIWNQPWRMYFKKRKWIRTIIKRKRNPWQHFQNHVLALRETGLYWDNKCALRTGKKLLIYLFFFLRQSGMINYFCSSPQSIIHTKVINKLDAYRYFVVYFKHTFSFTLLWLC